MNKLEQLLDHYGVKEQIEQTKQELLELSLALQRYTQHKKEINKFDVISEVADVENMLFQLKKALDIENDVKLIRIQKTERQLRRIEDARKR